MLIFPFVLSPRKRNRPSSSHRGCGLGTRLAPIYIVVSAPTVVPWLSFIDHTVLYRENHALYHSYTQTMNISISISISLSSNTSFLPTCSDFVTLMKDQFANFVVQRAIEMAEPSQRRVLVYKMRPLLERILKFMYARYVVTKVDLIVGDTCLLSP